MEISYQQCRAARALLNWSQSDLEKASEVAKKTIADFEREARTPYPRTLVAIQRALEAAGVEFLPDNGVRLKADQAAQAPDSGSARSPTSQRQSVATEKPATRKASRAKPLAMSKEAQIRALRERS